jgi:hypothetical protein
LRLFPLQGKGLGITLTSGIFNYKFSIWQMSNTKKAIPKVPQ